MAGGVPAPAQLFTDLAGGKAQAGFQRVEQGTLAGAGIAAEHHQTASGELFPQFCHALPGSRGEFQAAVSCLAVVRKKFRVPAQVALGHCQHGLNALVFRHGQHLIQHKAVGCRADGGYHQHQQVDICHRRADQEVLPGQEFNQIALAFPGEFRPARSPT